MAQHTPGPWAVYEFNPVAIGNKSRTVALITYNKDVSLEDHANARLIAAAPDLLEALQLAKDEIHNPGAGNSRGIDVCEIINAAIAKATES